MACGWGGNGPDRAGGLADGLFGEFGFGKVLDTFGLYPASFTIERGKKMSKVIIDETKQPRPAIIFRKSTANL